MLRWKFCAIARRAASTRRSLPGVCRGTDALRFRNCWCCATRNLAGKKRPNGRPKASAAGQPNIVSAAALNNTIRWSASTLTIASDADATMPVSNWPLRRVASCSRCACNTRLTARGKRFSCPLGTQSIAPACMRQPSPARSMDCSRSRCNPDVPGAAGRACATDHSAAGDRPPESDQGVGVRLPESPSRYPPAPISRSSRLAALCNAACTTSPRSSRNRSRMLLPRSR